MCGRFTLTSTPEELARRFELDAAPALDARYNIAPGQQVLSVRLEAGRRHARWLRWGLVPAWAADPTIGSRLINARVESVARRSAFRDALRERRCLIPADGFYEWAERGGFRQPYYVQPAQGGAFGFAGLWERWGEATAQPLESCTLLTGDATGSLRDVHGRMPLVVPRALHAAWLAADGREAQELLVELCQASPDWRLHPVSPRVNRADQEGEACIVPTREPPRQEALF